jgi:maltooligosyltrehalose trehalohydrolase
LEIAVTKRRLPIGADLHAGGTHFRVWAHEAKAVSVAFEDAKLAPIAMRAEEHGYFSTTAPGVSAGTRYRYRIGTGNYPDPASRFQPEGPHGPSEVVDPSRFRWTDTTWPGVTREGLVIYEMHIGTFTPEGTWKAAAAQLGELAKIGVSMVELMPVADFPGNFGWGYDGVDFFAPTRLYGSPDDMRAFVDKAHAVGIAVILDVVYNHFGPDGNYLNSFAKSYFSEKYKNEWGEALNYDGPDSAPVREFMIANAGYWIDEFHLDGLRLDATQQIFDDSKEHLLLAISRRVREMAGRRETYLVAENETQEAKLVRTAGNGGYELDALWNDDFHHSAAVALTGKSPAYYSDYHGTPQELISALKWGYLYQGQWYTWQKKRRGMPSLDLEPGNFVTFLQNHDQVANSGRGLPICALTSPGRLRALTALLLLGPGTPMLFQGQEFASPKPFLYFADHNPDLAALVKKGRHEFLKQFPDLATEPMQKLLHDPADPATFAQCRLDFEDRRRNAASYVLHADLMNLRRDDIVFKNPRRRGLDGAVLAEDAFVLRFFGDAGDDRLLLVNLGHDRTLLPVPEPLLVAPEGRSWSLLWSSDDVRYGGCGTPVPEKDAIWSLPGEATLVMAAEKMASRGP